MDDNIFPSKNIGSGQGRAELFSILPPVTAQKQIPVAWKAAWEPISPFQLVDETIWVTGKGGCADRITVLIP